MRKKVAIIGAGIGGLASAIRLAISGFDVKIFENSSYAGGKIAEFRKKGYRFDTGASLMTLPELVKELFILAGEDPGQYISFHKLDISCRYFYNDRSRISAFTNAEKFIGEIQQKTTAQPKHIHNFLKEAKELYKLTAKLFIFSPFQKLSTLTTPEAKKIFLKLYKLDALFTLHQRNQKSLRDKKLVQLFDRYATYNGSNPYRAPATLKIISHLEHNVGAYLPEGGMYEMIKALVRLAEKLNIQLNYNTTVEEIVMKNRKVTGIRYSDKFIAADYIICNADIYKVYDNILRNVKLPGRFKNQELSSSAILFYWGIRKKIPQLDVHNILFSGNYREEFRHIFKHKTIYHDPTVYIYISSKLIPADAPRNCENWFVMINTPNNSGQDWNTLRNEARKSIIQKIRTTLGIDIENHIEIEEYQDPERIEYFTDSYRGALYGPSSNSKLSAFYRHANYTKKIKGLYFAGGSVHPGGGIPLCFASAQIASQLIVEDSGK